MYMSFILTYLYGLKKTLVRALVLAAINQVFSLFDPQVFRLIIDNYVSKFDTFAQGDFVRGV